MTFLDHSWIMSSPRTIIKLSCPTCNDLMVDTYISSHILKYANISTFYKYSISSIMSPLATITSRVIYSSIKILVHYIKMQLVILCLPWLLLMRSAIFPREYGLLSIYNRRTY